MNAKELLEELVEDLKKRSIACDALAADIAPDEHRRIRLRGKASAYVHAAELVAVAIERLDLNCK